MIEEQLARKKTVFFQSNSLLLNQLQPAKTGRTIFDFVREEGVEAT